MAPDLSVVIPTLGGGATLRRVLEAYEQQDIAPRTFEVIVVVDANDPDPGAIAAAVGERPYPVRQLRGDVPGASGNRNTGLRAAQAPLILFTDDDTIPLPGMVAEHLRMHDRHPEEEVAILGLVRWSDEIEVTTFMRWLDTGIQFDFSEIEEGEVTWGSLVTANTSLKRALFDRVGLFDAERLPYLYEDVDWAYRASRHGLRLIHTRSAVVDHLKPVTLEDWQRRAGNVARAEWTFTRLHPELPPWFEGVFRHAASVPPASGRAVKLAPYVPRRMPWLGPAVWDRVDIYYKQQLAPHFLAAWDEVAQPVASSGGRSDSGP